MALRDQKQFPCWKTCKRWIQQYNNEGTTLCKCTTGNRISEREVNGQDLVNLAVNRMVHSKAYIDKVRACVHNMNPDNPPYSCAQIGCAKKRLGLHPKAASITSNCAYFYVNLFKHEQYWHVEYPMGVLGESTRDMIDLNRTITSWRHRIGSLGKYFVRRGVMQGVSIRRGKGV